MSQFAARRIKRRLTHRQQPWALDSGRVNIRIAAADVPIGGLPGAGLGSRIAALFASNGLTEPLAELRGQPASPAVFDDL